MTYENAGFLDTTIISEIYNRSLVVNSSCVSPIVIKTMRVKLIFAGVALHNRGGKVMKMVETRRRVPLLLWPFWAIGRLIGAILGLTGRIIGALLGLVLVIAGFAVSLTVIGAVIGIPLMLFGFLLMLRSLF